MLIGRYKYSTTSGEALIIIKPRRFGCLAESLDFATMITATATFSELAICSTYAN